MEERHHSPLIFSYHQECLFLLDRWEIQDQKRREILYSLLKSYLLFRHYAIFIEIPVLVVMAIALAISQLGGIFPILMKIEAEAALTALAVACVFVVTLVRNVLPARRRLMELKKLHAEDLELFNLLTSRDSVQFEHWLERKKVDTITTGILKEAYHLNQRSLKLIGRIEITFQVLLVIKMLFSCYLVIQVLPPGGGNVVLAAKYLGPLFGFMVIDRFIISRLNSHREKNIMPRLKELVPEGSRAEDLLDLFLFPKLMMAPEVV